MDTNRVKLLACPQMAKMAEEVRREGRNYMDPGQINWLRFNDGWPNVSIVDPESLKHQDVVFLACFDTMGNAMEQLMLISTLINQCKPLSLKIFLPFWPVGTKDRWDVKGEVVTAAELAKMMQFIPLTQSGPADLVIYDIHALQEESYFPNNINVDLQSAMPLALDMCFHGIDNLSIAFPDEGAYKRFRSYFEGKFPLILCEKRHYGDDRTVRIQEGNPQGRHVAVVDDLLLSCKTSIRCKEALLAAGASEVSLFATHGACPKASWKRLINVGFSEVWITNSCPETAEAVTGQKPLRVISLAPSIQDVVWQDITRARRR